ncbi:hypothetical protein T12_1624 [Trichinella patagoniensis]|uniref:Uncharacterized protein n=1 Tax=Trichinella patagoniensis TaxID=990121 RepID=A0A0V0Z478_9BILA|nr:hypothetical protein T12_1624 [Trichinella patagoniensis]
MGGWRGGVDERESWTNSTRLSDSQCDMGEWNLRMITMNKTAS